MGTSPTRSFTAASQSVVRELALRTFDTDAELTRGFARDPALPTEDWVVQAVETYCRRHLPDRLRLQVRAAIQADAELSALDLQDSHRNAAVIADALARAGVEAPPEHLRRRALMFVELVDALIRLAARVGPDEAEALIAEFARTVRDMLLRTGAAEGGP